MDIYTLERHARDALAERRREATRTRVLTRLRRLATRRPDPTPPPGEPAAGFALRRFTRGGYRPGSIGRLVALQARFYCATYGFDLSYEAETATAMAAFVRDFDPERDAFWTVERNGEPVGCLAVDGRDPQRGAQIRWVFLAEEARGRGLARRMLDDALAFCRRAGYGRVRLDTSPRLEAAVALYRRAGFRLERSDVRPVWGRTETVHTYALPLAPESAPPGGAAVRRSPALPGSIAPFRAAAYPFPRLRFPPLRKER